MRIKVYQDKDVLTAAKERLRVIYDLHDSVVVCFSGGKDSVHEDSIIWVQVDGVTMRTTCAGLLDQITGETFVKNGQVFIKPDQDLRILTASSRMQKDAKPIFGKVTYVMHHSLDPDQAIYKLRVRGGRSVRVTGDHSVMVARNRNGLRFIAEEARDASLNWSLPVVPGPDIEGDEVDLPDWFLRLAGLWVADGCHVYLRGKPLGKMVISTGGDAKVIDFLSRIPREPSRTERALARFREIRPNYPDQESALLAVAQELGVSRNCVAGAVYRGPKRTATHIKCKVKKNGDAWLCNKLLVDKLKSLGFEGNSHTKRIPSWLFTASRRQIGLFLAGYFDGDGCLARSGVSCCSVSKPLAEDIKDLLGRLGIEGGFSRSRSTGGYPSTSEGCYGASVSGHYDLERFVQWVPTFKDKAPLFDRVGKPLRPDHAFRTRKVKEISKTAGYPSRVFDFEVQDNHMFVADGVLVHNSCATLHLTWEVAQELGRDHVDVLFRDEELIPDCVVDFVDEYRRKPWVRMNWFAIPLESSKFILGRSIPYVQWDPKRETHLREKPPWAISLPPGDDRVFSQFNADAFLSQWYRGKVAFVTGIRADESLTRFRSCVNKLNLNYINKSSSKNVTLCKPIYDWCENDVFKYFYENKVRYNAIYDVQHLAGRPLRVATPFLAEGAKFLDKLRAVDPSFYERVMALMPEMRVQERYWRDMDRRRLKEQCSSSFAAVISYIDENFDDPIAREKAMVFLEEARRLHIANPGAYPLKYIFTYVLNGNFKRTVIPLNPRDQVGAELAPDAHVQIREKAYK